MQGRYVRFFGEIGIEDVRSLGGKNALLGEMYRNLSSQGVRVPNGFAITADAYRYILEHANAVGPLHEALDGLHANDIAALMRRGRRAREILYGAPLPMDLQKDILDAYRKLRRQYGEGVSLAVRSSATAEDLLTASFAGPQSYLHISGEDGLLDACKRCFASLFTDRSIHYRIGHRIDHFKVALSIGVMKMVRSDIAASGIMSTLGTETCFRDVVSVTAAYGLGENVVQGAVDPDEFMVFNPTFKRGARAVVRRTLGSKKLKMIYRQGRGGKVARSAPTPQIERDRFCISDEDALTLAEHAIKIADYCSLKTGHAEPMDIEWAKDGEDGCLYIVHARPRTVATNKDTQYFEELALQGKAKPRMRRHPRRTLVRSGRSHSDVRFPVRFPAYPSRVHRKLRARVRTP